MPLCKQSAPCTFAVESSTKMKGSGILKKLNTVKNKRVYSWKQKCCRNSRRPGKNMAFGECSLPVFTCVGGVHIRLHILEDAFPVANTGSEWAVFSYTMRYVNILKMITAMRGVDMAPETILFCILQPLDVM